MLIIDEEVSTGSGIFDTVMNLVRQYGPSLLQSAAKSAASEAGKRSASKVFSPNQSIYPQVIPSTIIPSTTGITQVPNFDARIDEILNKYKSRYGGNIEMSSPKSIDGAIDIRDYVKSPKGSGIKSI